MDEYAKELLPTVQRLIANELSILEDIARTIHLDEDKQDIVYKDKFPKTCPKCGIIFKDRESYIKNTSSPNTENSVFEFDKASEFRNCRCNTTMCIVTGERRDMSEFGHIRRDIFFICKHKVQSSIEALEKNDKAAIAIVRDLMNEVINEVKREFKKELNANS